MEDKSNRLLDEAATRSETPVGEFVSCRHMCQL